jgi:N utilization substance protein B
MTDAPAPSRRARSVARLLAAQALYQIALADGLTETVVAEFLAHRQDERIEGRKLAAADRAHFVALVEGCVSRLTDLDALIESTLAEGWTLARLGTLLHAILRVATFELLERTDVPARVVIDEYVGLTRAFFTDREPAFVNGALDRLARRLRPDELPKAGAARGHDVVPKPAA